MFASNSFSLDTSFMYVMAVLCMVKLYQNRHPDINASAYATFGVLAVAILIGKFRLTRKFWRGYVWYIFRHDRDFRGEPHVLEHIRRYLYPNVLLSQH